MENLFQIPSEFASACLERDRMCWIKASLDQRRRHTLCSLMPESEIMFEARRGAGFPDYSENMLAGRCTIDFWNYVIFQVFEMRVLDEMLVDIEI
jgi:hypothetical protein